jgi:hypothetical protein
MAAHAAIPRLPAGTSLGSGLGAREQVGRRRRRRHARRRSAGIPHSARIGAGVHQLTYIDGHLIPGVPRRAVHRLDHATGPSTGVPEVRRPSVTHQPGAQPASLRRALAFSESKASRSAESSSFGGEGGEGLEARAPVHRSCRRLAALRGHRHSAWPPVVSRAERRPRRARAAVADAMSVTRSAASAIASTTNPAWKRAGRPNSPHRCAQ